MKKERFNTTIDLILLILFTLSSIYSLLEVYITGYFPVSLIVVCAVVLLIAAAGYFALILSTQRFRFLRRILLFAVTVALFSFSLHSSIFRHSSSIIDTSNYMNHQLNLVSNVENADEISDLDGMKIGYLQHDLRYLSILENVLEEKRLDIELVEYVTHSDLSQAMEEKQIQGCYVSNFNLSLLEDYENYERIEIYQYQDEINLPAVYKNLIEDPFTVFISGSDSLSNVNSVGNSDFNLLAMINPLSKKIELISLPKNLYVPNPAYSYYPDILSNTSNEGIDNTMYALSAAFGFDIDYYVRLNFSSFIDLIDQVGGIEVEIEESFCEQNEFRQENTVCVEAGSQVLSGQEALALARHVGEGNERLINQQKLIVSLASKLLQNMPMSSLINVMNDTIATSITTNLDMEEVNRLVANIVSDIDSWQLEMHVLEEGINERAFSVSMDPKQLMDVYILSEEDLSQVYELYLDTMNQKRLDQFTFSLNELRGEKVLPTVHERLVTAENYHRKIVEYFALEPYSTVHPIQIEEWENESYIQDPLFDPSAPINPLS